MSAAPGPQAERTHGSALLWLVSLGAIALVALARLRLLAVPLERDEGEYAYAAQTLIHGFAPYELAANMKLPGTYYVYALVMAVFGQSREAVHLGLLLANLAAIAFVFLIARRLCDTTAGLAAGTAYALMSFGRGVMGTAAHATHFVVLFALVAIWLLLRWDESRRAVPLILSGLCFGLAFLMKQPGVFFGVFGAAYVIAVLGRELRQGAVIRALASFLLACAAPYLALCTLLWSQGTFDRFWSWTVDYARFYGTAISFGDGFRYLVQSGVGIVLDDPALWLLAGWGLLESWRAPDGRQRAFVATGLLAASFLSIVPGLAFRAHYFVQLLPAVALLAGIGLARACARFSRARAALLWVGCLVISIGLQSQQLFRQTPLEVSRALYGLNPFPEAIAVGAYLREHASPYARIAVLGSEPEIYFYAQRLSASSHIYTYALMERQPLAERMQGEMIADIESMQPEYVVFVSAATSWPQTERSSTRLLDWWKEYRTQRYALAGIVDIVSNDETVFKWGAEIANYRPRSSNTIQVYRRV